MSRISEVWSDHCTSWGGRVVA